MRLPVNNPQITSDYGDRFLNGKWEFHGGLDFVESSRKDKRVYAVMDGTVSYDMDNYQESLRWTKRKHSLGNFVIIDHNINGTMYHIRYCHLDSNKVSQGQKIVGGCLLGTYGNVGISYGAHLHCDAFLCDAKWTLVNIEKLFKEIKIL